jgi:hypothetical protein
MVGAVVENEPFRLACGDPHLSALIGTIEEPQGSVTASLAGRLTLEWWESHGVGPTSAELLGAVFSRTDWEEVVEDPSRTVLQRRAQGKLLEQWLLSYWSRLGVIALVPGHDEVFKPGTV